MTTKPIVRRALAVAAGLCWVISAVLGGLIVGFGLEVLPDRYHPGQAVVAVLAAVAGGTITLGLWLDRAGCRAMMPIPVQTALDVGIKIGMRMAQTGAIHDTGDAFDRLMAENLMHDLGVQDPHTPPLGHRP